MFNRGTGFKAHKAEVVRIRVKKCDGMMQPEYKKLCVDPQLTSFDIMRNLLARAFDIKTNFTISYLAKDDQNQDVYLSLLSDWDLDAAFLGSSDPFLRLKVDLKPFEEGLDDWDLVSDSTSSQRRGLLHDSAAIFGSLTGTITSHVGKTVTSVSKAMGLWNDDQKSPQPIKPPMTDREFHHFLDGVGHMIQPGEFRLSVFRGGVEPALRKVVWRHLLNIFPERLSGKERFSYLQAKVREYYRLRDEWRAFFLKGDESEEIRTVANMVKKDVLRTDRHHQYYAGADDNKNVLSLFNLLVTYAVTHPDVLYCQGMSDIASPILMVEDDEAHAYLCFCGLMKRLRNNFSVNGLAMTTKFQHLSLLLQHHDPDFYAYLKEHNADDMFFCYRWLLLELKREFPLDDALCMLEIMWSSLPPDPPETELQLVDSDYQKCGVLTSPTSPTMAHQAYVLLRSRLRKPADSSSDNTSTSLSTSASSNGGDKSLSQSSDVITPCDDKAIDPQDFPEVEDSTTVEILRSKAALIEKALGEELIYSDDSPDSPKHDTMSEGPMNVNKSPVSERLASPSSPSDPSGPDSTSHIASSATINTQSSSTCFSVTENESTNENAASSNESSPTRNTPQVTVSVTVDDGREINDLVQDMNLQDLSTSPQRPSDIPLNTEDAPQKLSAQSRTNHDVSSCEEAMENLSIDYVKVNQKLMKLPSPSDFGHGNPFLMFACLTLFVQHRDVIMANRMDYNDLAMHFDKMVRKHDVHNVVHQARALYTSYLKSLGSSDSTISSDTPSSDDISV